MITKKGKPSVFLGQRYFNKYGDEFEVVEYLNAHKVRVLALSTKNSNIWLSAANLKAGKIFDPLKPSLCGVGYLGIGPYQSKYNRISDEAYNRWKNMIFRCYDYKTQEKYPAYKGCTVNAEWHCFQNYAHWYYSNPYYQKNWNVDKDLLVFGNREYGPNTCVLLPPAINSALQMRVNKLDGLPHGVKINSTCKHLFEASSSIFDKKIYIGLYATIDEAQRAYKDFRENYIRDLVKAYENTIDPAVYKKLMNFKVEDYGR